MVQHPDMASSVPHVGEHAAALPRCWGIKKQGIVYAFLRIGNGKVMDNVDCGGMAARALT